MKNLLIPSLALIAFISSCTSQRYAHVQKIKVKNEEQKETKYTKIEAELIESSSKFSSNEAPVKLEAEEISNINNGFIASNTENNNQIINSKQNNNKISNHSKASKKEIKRLLKENSVEKIKENKSINKSQDSSTNYIKIGLIILLIGFVVGLVFGGLGWLISVVGAVLIIYGLILML